MIHGRNYLIFKILLIAMDWNFENKWFMDGII